MLKSITCDQATFKSVTFRDGLNLVLADKTSGSARKGTRNGSGKTTLIEIIHYCLGASKPSKDETLANPAVQGWRFSLTFVANGRTLAATRQVGSDDLIVTGDTQGLPLGANGEIKREHWTQLLGTLMFGLNTSQIEQKKVPSFRQ